MGIAPYTDNIQGGRQVAAPTINRVKRLWRNPPCGYAASPLLCKGGGDFVTD